MFAALSQITYYLPDSVLTNSELAAQFGDWTAEKIEEKTGIAERRIAGPGQCSSDLAFEAARKLFETGACSPADIDYLLLCTQSPDYFLPTTACLLQDRLGLPTTCGALDFNLGCSGWVYGLGLAKGLVESGQARNVLLLTAETYSKFLDPGDHSVRTIFGDGAAATLIRAVGGDGAGPYIGPVVAGTDGSGAKHLLVAGGGLRQPAVGLDSPPTLRMNGPEIFAFTLRVVPEVIERALAASNMTFDDIDLFVFHQANKYILEHLRKKMRIPVDKFVLDLRDCGNTVSSAIPIALQRSICAGRVKPGATILAVGFGVGLSWAAVVVRLM